MQSLQRRMGRLLPRTADESQVAILLKDFEDVDKMLDSLIAASKAWRDAWNQILRRQQQLAAEFDGIYQPLVGSGSENREHVQTADHIASRAMKLAKEYGELDVDMQPEVNEMDLRVIKPAEDAKASIQPMKKVIKKRQDRKLDYERYQGRYDSSMKKIGRSDRENNALRKHEADLARSKEEYQVADQRMRDTLPSILQAVFSLLPYILVAQICIQNNLLGHCYTQISDFCQEEGFPVPAPDFPDLISNWELDFDPAKKDVESLAILRKGKTVHTPMRSNTEPSKPPTGYRRPSHQSTTPSIRSEVSPARSDTSSMTQRSFPPTPNLANKPSPAQTPVSEGSSPGGGRSKMLSVPSQGSLALSMPNYGSSPHLGLTADTLGAQSPAGPKADYFSRDRLASSGSWGGNSTTSPLGAQAKSPGGLSPGSVSPSSGGGSTGLALAAAAAAKKKAPPPPPKPKGIASNKGTFVTALYDFAGQGHGDLVFKEGDRIRVIKRTDSTQDWWEGELAGVRGAFPANYVQVA